MSLIAHVTKRKWASHEPTHLHQGPREEPLVHPRRVSALAYLQDQTFVAPQVQVFWVGPTEVVAVKEQLLSVPFLHAGLVLKNTVAGQVFSVVPVFLQTYFPNEQSQSYVKV